jgi:hypothetical protein
MPKMEFRIMIPDVEPTTVSGWKIALEHAKATAGLNIDNVDNAATCLIAFTRGKLARAAELQSKSDTPITIPPTAIFTGESPPVNVGGLTNTDGKIHTLIVSEKLLRNVSSHPPENLVTTYLKGNSKKVGFKGRIDEYFELCGVEEMDHADYHQTNNVNPETILNPNTTSPFEYDAQPHEYRALEAKLAYARTRGMTSETIALLEKQYRKVTDYRNEHNL